MMIVLDWREPDDSGRFVLIFGIGLIGQSILNAIEIEKRCNVHYLPFDWSKKAVDDVADILRYLETKSKRSVDVVWSAGKFGFGSSRNSFDTEIENFKLVLTLFKKIAVTDDNLEINFHHLSSAGGLFEGQVLVSVDTPPCPLRAYGDVKLLQEELIATALPSAMTSVYRPSSVYGFGGFSSRRGLIDSLIFNAITNNVTTIYGGPDTLRDYVFVRDIGGFIARRIVAEKKDGGVFFLASGKPTSVIEAIVNVELILDRRLLRRYDLSGLNASNMSYRKEALPAFWQPTDLATGIRSSISMVKAQVESSYLNVQR